jgi:UDP-2,3-diacylglucosamine pyrophosphatase LpxH
MSLLKYRMPKLSLIFSDTEAGMGDNTDDFVEETLFCDTIRSHFKESKKHESDLILNGDIFDFLKASYKGEYPRHITEKVSLWKLKRIAKAHPEFFYVMKEWLQASKSNRIVFIIGNHDYDIVYPRIQEEIKNIIVGKVEAFRKRIVFPGFEFTDNLLHVEHGSQLDRYFRVDPDKFVHKKFSKYVKDPFLLLPWGHNALYDHFIHIKKEFPILDRIVPRIHTVEALPFMLKRRLYLDSALYMMKGFFYTQFRYWNDVLYRFPARTFGKYMFSFMRKEFELTILSGARKKLRRGDFWVLSVGHNHKGKIKKVGKHKIILNTGNWRDEYTPKLSVRKFYPKPKSYGYLLHTKNSIIDAKLIKVKSQMRPFSMEELKAMLRGDLPTPYLKRK